MIGIVVVSHSAKLAEGIYELVEQMTKGQVPFAVAGGIDDPDNPIGTDAMRIYEAIETVYNDDGVLVLMDMGSALLSAEMALEFLAEDQQENIRLCAAPVVEGAVAAAVQAMVSNDINQIVTESLGALTVKSAQLGDAVPQESAAVAPTNVTLTNQITLTIRNFHGLHARPAAQFVGTAAKFQAQVTVRNLTRGVGPINAKSINQVTTLGARQGHEIGVAAEGPDAGEALTALQVLVNDNFGESEEPPKSNIRQETIQSSPANAGEIVGIAVSPGIAIGPVAQYQLAPITVEQYQIDDIQAEWQRLDEAIQTAKKEIQTLHKQATTQVGRYEASIFEAHQLFLDDPTLVDTARQDIQNKQINAEIAWQSAIDTMVNTYRNLDDSYLQARAADVADVGQRVLKLLTGGVSAALTLPQPSILIASNLTPSDTAQLDPNQVLGICTEKGSATSHSAILARALGIPAVVGLGKGLSDLTNGTLLALNGKQGQVWVDPDSEHLSALKQQRDKWLADQKTAKAASQAPAQTRDGQRVEVVANIGGLHDVKVALEAGAEGVGLFRTEFLYLDRTTAPTENEQLAVYKSIAADLGTRPFVIRTLDIGGDKPLPYMDTVPEENPFLGWRGIRMLLDRPDMLKSQLRAILQASPGHQFKIMFPMVSTVEEVRATKVILAQAQAELREKGIPFDDTIEIGIMVEVPATVAIADQLATEVDFFSIGTNDLSQYTMAADRTNPNVADLPNAFQPAVLRLIRQTIQAAHTAGIWVGLCGEFAGDPLATSILLGLGLDEFSMSAPAIPGIKQVMSRLTVSQAQAIAKEALNLTSAQAVRDYVESKTTT